MFPTCSNRLLAGRKALSATDLTISPPGPRGPLAADSEPNVFHAAAVRHPQPLGRDGRVVGPGASHRVRWYVARALGEETAISARPRRTRRGGSLARLSPRSPSVSDLGIAGLRRRASARTPASPIGNFPVAVNTAKFPTDQRLAETSTLELAVENAGTETIPDLAVTIYTGDPKSAGGRRSRLRSDQPGLADPNRPVWVLEYGFPKLLTRQPERGRLAKRADRRRRGRADRHLRLRPARAGRRPRTSSGR